MNKMSEGRWCKRTLQQQMERIRRGTQVKSGREDIILEKEAYNDKKTSKRDGI